MLDWQLQLGHLVLSVPLLGILVYLIKIDGMLRIFKADHRLLMMDWAQRNHPDRDPEDVISKLPWRQ